MSNGESWKSMKVMLDTNIIIFREDDNVLHQELQQLLRVMSEAGWDVVVHPLSIKELETDRDFERRAKVLSKVSTYPVLDRPPQPDNDAEFLETIRVGIQGIIEVDLHLLYALYRNVADFLLTEDKGIHRMARRVGLSDRVVAIGEALALFSQLTFRPRVISPPALHQDYCYNLDLNDPIFDDLKENYIGFTGWMKRISKEHRPCWVNRREDSSIGALMILKDEDETIEGTPVIPRKPRLKICTMKVTHNGQKIGELLLRIAFDHAMEMRYDEIYLTHFVEEDDRLVDLIDQFGFVKKALLKDGQDVFIKRMMPPECSIGGLDAIDFNRLYFPSFYDGPYCTKFIIPIRPEYHDRLFTDIEGRQTTLFEHGGDFIIEGNTIKKAYICARRIKTMKPGDLLLFYRSDDQKQITNLGLIEQVHHDVRDGYEITRIVGKRTVYGRYELDEMASGKSGALVILFRHLFHLPRPLSYQELLGMGILKGPPQSIMKIDHQDYLDLKERGGIDERYTCG